MLPHMRIEFRYVREAAPDLKSYGALTRGGWENLAKRYPSLFSPTLSASPLLRRAYGRDVLPNFAVFHVEDAILHGIQRALGERVLGREKVSFSSTDAWECRETGEELREKGRVIGRKLECIWGVKFNVSDEMGAVTHRGWVFAKLDCVLFSEPEEANLMNRIACTVKEARGYVVPLTW